MILKSALEKLSIGPSLRNRIAAVFTIFASAACASTLPENPKVIEPSHDIASSEKEDPLGAISCEMFERIGAEGPGLQPTKQHGVRTYVLCKHLPGVAEMNGAVAREMANEALNNLCAKTRRCVDDIDINDTEGSGMSFEDYHCVKVTAPMIPIQDA